MTPLQAAQTTGGFGKSAPPSLTISSKRIEVIRVEVQTCVVDMNYRRVELVIDGEEYEMSAPEAQRLGQLLNQAAGGTDG